MRTSFYENEYGTIPTIRNISINDFSECLVSASKSVVCFSPAEIKDGGTRCKKDVLSIHFGVLDIDGANETDCTELKKHFSSVLSCIYTTWSNQPPKYKLRVIIPFSTPVLAKDWPRIWENLAAMAGGLADRSCKNLDRLYYWPSCPVERIGDAWTWFSNGPVLDVSTLLLPKKPIIEGRNNQLTSLAGTMRRRDLAPEAIRAALLVHNQTLEEPLEENEVEQIAEGIVRYEPVGGFPLTDLGNANRFIAAHGDEVRYIPGLGWFEWEKERWRAREGLSAKIGRFFVNLGASEEAEIAKHAFRCHAVGRIKACETLLREDSRIQCQPSDLDQDPWLFQVQNGVIDLHTGQLRPVNKEDLLFKQSKVTFDPQAICPIFDQFLENALPNSNIQAFIMRWLGSCLTGITKDQTFCVFYGEGRNGKSTLVDTILHVLGDYGKPIPSELLLKKHGERHPTGLASLLGLRLAAASESEECKALDVSMVKSITGDNEISARFMRQNFFCFNPTHKLLLSTNHQPLIRESKDGIWRRLKLVPWEVQFKNPDRDMLEKLRGEAPGILNRLVEGCLQWQEIGLSSCPEVELASEEYREDQDTFGEFFLERCIKDPKVKVSKSEFRQAYEMWCHERGEMPLGNLALSQKMRELKIRSGTHRCEKPYPTRCWVGVTTT